jgi:hypothetical protein
MNGNEKDEYYFSSWMAEMLHNFEAYITRIEVYLFDEKAKKKGLIL